jgi:PilZ domain-containing protein
MSPAAEIRALVVTRDMGLTATFTDISREFGISAQKSKSSNGGVPDELTLSKYEALLIDFETVPQTIPIFTTIRQSPANRNAVVFAVVGSPDSRQRARDQGATFLLERPLEGEGIRRVLQAAYGMMTSERRRYFRCTAEIPVQLVRDSGEEIACKTINVSSSGMAVNGLSPFKTGEKLHIALTLPDSNSQVRAQATVMWDDKHGKTGLSIECANSQMQRELDTWLDAQFQPGRKQ